MLPDSFAPLIHFYRSAGLRIPAIELLAGPYLPEPARRLLFHDSDMTSTLQGYFGDEIRLEVLGRVESGETVTREVTLRLQQANQPVEFGAIRIEMDQMPEPAKQLVREGRLPLGGILNDFRIPYESHPSRFFRVSADDLMIQCFALEGPSPLYGRCNTLTYRDGATLASVVEILPPLSRLEDFR